MKGLRLFIAGTKYEKKEIKAYLKMMNISFKVKKMKFKYSGGTQKLWIFLYEGTQSTENDLIRMFNGSKLW